MGLADCRFSTQRLSVAPWHEVVPDDRELLGAVRSLLTPAVVAHLPPDWDGLDDIGSERWVAERDGESTVLLASATTGEVTGLVILAETPVEDAGDLVDVRLGYLIGEVWQGRGLATELVGGLLDWCRGHRVRSVAGGVADGNVASARVLQRVGFNRLGTTEGGEDLWVIRLG